MGIQAQKNVENKLFSMHGTSGVILTKRSLLISSPFWIPVTRTRKGALKHEGHSVFSMHFGDNRKWSESLTTNLIFQVVDMFTTMHPIWKTLSVSGLRFSTACQWGNHTEIYGEITWRVCGWQRGSSREAWIPHWVDLRNISFFFFFVFKSTKLSHVIPLDTRYYWSLHAIMRLKHSQRCACRLNRGHEWRLLQQPSALIFTRIASPDLNGTIFNFLCRFMWMSSYECFTASFSYLELARYILL